MTAICRNVDDFFDSERGQKRDMDDTSFHMDFSTAKRSPRGRSSNRRSHSCPAGWVGANNCPHSDQEPVWRHDGQWWTTALAPPPDGLNHILAPLQVGNSITTSGVYYTCDEFPAASWIEGGDGRGVVGNGRQGGASSTRCAGFRCRRGIKAEQNWQASAHALLRYELFRVIGVKGAWPSGGIDKKKQVVKFHLRLVDKADGVAARVVSYSSEDPEILDQERIVSQAKRDKKMTHEEFRRWANTVTMDELEDLTSGKLHQHMIFSNASISEVQNNGDGDEDESDRAWSNMFESPLEVVSTVTDLHQRNVLKNLSSHSIMRRTPSPSELHPNPVRRRNSTAPIHAPLVGNATLSTLSKALKLVDEAIEESSRLNSIRLANPLRNKYQLRPGTVTGSLKSRQKKDQKNAQSSPIPQLLNITDEIAAAAALVAEADAQQYRYNVTKKAVTAAAAASQSGSYWMEHIDRKGTVPWGNDASYKVFRNVIDYGAVGDGVTDDTKAINKAMQDGKRCGEKCNGSTTKNAIVYFPPGKYLISTTIEMPFGTQVIGDVSICT